MAGSKSRISASTDAATDGVTRVEIVTRGDARREYTPDKRAMVLTEAAMPGARVLLVAQRYGISPSLVYRWRREAAGRPARQAPPRAPRFVPLLVDGVRRAAGQVHPRARRWAEHQRPPSSASTPRSTAAST
jgi:transposase